MGEKMNRKSWILMAISLAVFLFLFPQAILAEAGEDTGETAFDASYP